MLVLELVRSRARELGGCNDASFSRSTGPDPRVSPPKLRLSFSTPAFPGPGAALPLACHRSASRSRGPLWTSRSPSTLSGVDRKPRREGKEHGVCTLEGSKCKGA